MARGVGAGLLGARGYQVAITTESALKWVRLVRVVGRGSRAAEAMPGLAGARGPAGGPRSIVRVLFLSTICEPFCASLTARGSPVGQHASKQNRDDELSRHRSALGCPAPQESSPLSSCVS